MTDENKNTPEITQQSTESRATSGYGQARPKPGLYQVVSGQGLKGLIFQNESQEGRHFSTVKYSRSYRDKETGEWHYTDTLTRREQDQMGFLVHEVSRVQNQLDRINARHDRLIRQEQQATQGTQEHDPAQGLASQRDLALANKAPDQTSNQDVRTPSRAPDVEP